MLIFPSLSYPRSQLGSADAWFSSNPNCIAPDKQSVVKLHKPRSNLSSHKFSCLFFYLASHIWFPLHVVMVLTSIFPALFFMAFLPQFVTTGSGFVAQQNCIFRLPFLSDRSWTVPPATWGRMWPWPTASQLTWMMSCSTHIDNWLLHKSATNLVWNCHCYTGNSVKDGIRCPRHRNTAQA